MGGCKLRVLESAQDQLDGLPAKHRASVLERMTRLAAECGHPLDRVPSMKRLSGELSRVRKRRVGRHRVFFTGLGCECTYSVVLLKPFKKSGVDDEDDPSFQRKLIVSLGSRVARVLPP